MSVIEPVDPDSPRGRAIAGRLGRSLALVSENAARRDREALVRAQASAAGPPSDLPAAETTTAVRAGSPRDARTAVIPPENGTSTRR